MTDAADPDTATHQIAVPVADILDRPDGRRQRQLLFGEPVVTQERGGGAALIHALRDGYTGFVREEVLAPVSTPTHRVVSLATHFYVRPDFKSGDVATLSFGSQVTVVGTEGPFSRTREGVYLPSTHLAPAHLRFRDPAGVAELFLGTPYLWGGNSRLGLDCSGLVQAACLACGIACPGDSGEQEQQVGYRLTAQQPLQRGDLLFWRGHVAMMVSPTMMIHSNAYHMATAYEPMADAVARIIEQGDGPVTGRRRPASRD